MNKLADPFQTLRTLNNDQRRYYYSLLALEEREKCGIPQLPVSIRILLESLLRHCDGKKVKEEDVRQLARWNAKKPQDVDVPFIVARVILQDFTGVPLLVDLASMRDAIIQHGGKPEMIEPKVPVDLVVDHSVQVDRAGSEDAFDFNLQMELERNLERYTFLKWGQEAFKTFKVIPPGIGIVHQVNLEYLATLITEEHLNGISLLYPDTLVGTDSHTTMINGLGVVGWGVGGIEAEAGMLGQPIFLQMPEVIGFHLIGQLQEGVTATDLTLRITEILRQENVVSKIVEFFGEGAATLTVADRATIGNMSPEYGATMGFFPADEKSLSYLRMTGRSEEQIAQAKDYLKAQGLFGIPRKGEVIYTKELELDLNSITPSVSGPKRPQDRIALSELKSAFLNTLINPIPKGYGKFADEQPKVGIHSEGAFSLYAPHIYGGIPRLGNEADQPLWSEAEMVANRPYISTEMPDGLKYVDGKPMDSDAVITHGSIVIAAITSCTNTSNPSVMIGAGLLAKKAVEKGLKVNRMIKTSLAPGSRVVTDYLEALDLQKYLDMLGFQLVAYGCTTCIGNSGPLDEHLEDAIKQYDLIAASVLSGNRNFEARIHGSIKANFLMSPPLVVAFAIAGRIDIDMEHEPLGHDPNGNPVFLRDIWPSNEEIKQAIETGLKPDLFLKRYSRVIEDATAWKEIRAVKRNQYAWDLNSTYIRNPPYFENFSLNLPKQATFENLHALAIFGDSVTTDHISPAGTIRQDSPAGKYLITHGVKPFEFNSYGSRRGNHHVMMRGTFANVRIRNKMAEGKEGGYTKLMPDGTLMTIFEATQFYAERKIPLIIFAGKDYGMGSSRDWAAKGTALLGIKAVVAQSFERIHRSNLIGMGVLPLQFLNEDSVESLGLTGEETFDLVLEKALTPQQTAILKIKRNQDIQQVPLLCRLDTTSEVEYYKHGGILPFVLRQLLMEQQ
jgi:aconitate hydratase